MQRRLNRRQCDVHDRCIQHDHELGETDEHEHKPPVRLRLHDVPLSPDDGRCHATGRARAREAVPIRSRSPSSNVKPSLAITFSEATFGLRRDRDDATEPELTERPGDGRRARPRWRSHAPPDRVERPADLRIARPDAVELGAGAADQLARLAPFDGEQAEAVLGPVPVPPIEGLVALGAALHPGEMARVLGIGIPARNGVAVCGAKAPQGEPRRSRSHGEHGRRQRRRWERSRSAC